MSIKIVSINKAQSWTPAYAGETKEKKELFLRCMRNVSYLFKLNLQSTIILGWLNCYFDLWVKLRALLDAYAEDSIFNKEKQNGLPAEVYFYSVKFWQN